MFGLLDNGYSELSITSEHAVAIDTLSPLHKDLFDRILIAQTMVEGFTLLTTDALVAHRPRYAGFGGHLLSRPAPSNTGMLVPNPNRDRNRNRQ